jgi:hypothetical protein
LGIGDWGLGIGPNPQSPIPNPQSPIYEDNISEIYIIPNNYEFDFRLERVSQFRSKANRNDVKQIKKVFKHFIYRNIENEIDNLKFKLPIFKFISNYLDLDAFITCYPEKLINVNKIEVLNFFNDSNILFETVSKEELKKKKKKLQDKFDKENDKYNEELVGEGFNKNNVIEIIDLSDLGIVNDKELLFPVFYHNNKRIIMNTDFYMQLLSCISEKVISYYEMIDYINSFYISMNNTIDINQVEIKNLERKNSDSSFSFEDLIEKIISYEINNIDDFNKYFLNVPSLSRTSLDSDFLMKNKFKVNYWVIFNILYLADKTCLLLCLKNIESKRRLTYSKDLLITQKDKFNNYLIKEFFKIRIVVKLQKIKQIKDEYFDNFLENDEERKIEKVYNSDLSKKLENEIYKKYLEFEIVLKQSYDSNLMRICKETFLFRIVCSNINTSFPFSVKEKTNRVIRNFSNRESLIRISFKMIYSNKSSNHINCCLVQAYFRLLLKRGVSIPFCDVDNTQNFLSKLKSNQKIIRCRINNIRDKLKLYGIINISENTDKDYNIYDEDDGMNFEINDKEYIKRIKNIKYELLMENDILLDPNNNISDFRKYLDLYEKNLIQYFYQDLINKYKKLIVFDFYGYSNSQFRIKSATLCLNAQKVRDLSGKYNDLNICKYGSRLGQTLTTTSPGFYIDPNDILKRSDKICHYKDTINGVSHESKHVYSDGCAYMSSKLAHKIKDFLKLKTLPSCFQGRFQGCKGVWSIKRIEGCKIAIRDSQKKFESNFTEFEVCDYSKYREGHLNKQIINLLLTLGIEDDDIEYLLKSHLNILTSTDKFVDFMKNRYVKQYLIRMIEKGINPDNDIFCFRLMKSNYELMCTELKSKNRILVKHSCVLKGIIDEYDLLEENQVYACISESNNHKDPNNFVLTGNLIVTRCPCHFSGDVRKVNFVNFRLAGDGNGNDKKQNYSKHRLDNEVTEDKEKYTIIRPAEDMKKVMFLKELVNVIVFPSKGVRNLPNEMSGGDLDGDDFFVFWDKNLVKIEQATPFDFVKKDLHYIDERIETASCIKKAPYEKIEIETVSNITENSNFPNLNIVANEVSTPNIKELINFFINYEGASSLGQISNLHLVIVDQDLIKGAENEDAIEIAKLASRAVDAPKSGEMISVPIEFRKKYNTFPHYMGKAEEKSYKSTHLLGRLYDYMVENTMTKKNYFEKKEINLLELTNKKIEFNKNNIDRFIFEIQNTNKLFSYEDVKRQKLIQKTIEEKIITNSKNPAHNFSKNITDIKKITEHSDTSHFFNNINNLMIEDNNKLDQINKVNFINDINVINPVNAIDVNNPNNTNSKSKKMKEKDLLIENNDFNDLNVEDSFLDLTANISQFDKDKIIFSGINYKNFNEILNSKNSFYDRNIKLVKNQRYVNEIDKKQYSHYFLLNREEFKLISKFIINIVNTYVVYNEYYKNLNEILNIYSLDSIDELYTGNIGQLLDDNGFDKYDTREEIEQRLLDIHNNIKNLIFVSKPLKKKTYEWSPSKENISVINGIGDWGLGIGDWAQSPIPNPQSPIPNPHL